MRMNLAPPDPTQAAIFNWMPVDLHLHDGGLGPGWPSTGFPEIKLASIIQQGVTGRSGRALLRSGTVGQPGHTVRQAMSPAKKRLR